MYKKAFKLTKIKQKIKQNKNILRYLITRNNG